LGGHSDLRRRRPAIVVALLVLGVGGCGGGRAGSFAAQATSGESHYRESCAGCHQATGGIGPVLSRRVLASYGSAAGLFTYLRTTMPYGAPRTLEEDAYWAIVAFLVDSLGGGVPPRALDAGNAAQVLLTLDGS